MPGSPLHIVRLTSTNIKRISAATVEPDPDGNLVIITGRNGQGKTSLLDSITLAMAGGKQGKETVLPIRQGETRASVEIDFGEFKVIKSWTADAKPQLVVMAPDGHIYKTPQTFLDGLVGSLSFDPLAFTRLKPAEQVAALLAIAPLPFDPLEIAAERDMVFGQRTDVNRAIRNLEGELAGFSAEIDDAPDEPISTSAVVDELENAAIVARANQHVEAQRVAGRAQVQMDQDRVTALETELAEAQARLVRTTEGLAKWEAETLADVPDASVFREQLANAEAINERVRLKQEKAAVAAKVVHAQEVANDLTLKIEEIDKRKTDALKELGDKMPVPGLSFDDTGVTYQGLPFGQASAAEQLRVSAAMAMAADPTIRIMRIHDGSLLDTENLAILADMAAAHDYQVWIEIVDGAVGFVIEDGAVVSTPA